MFLKSCVNKCYSIPTPWPGVLHYYRCKFFQITRTRMGDVVGLVWSTWRFKTSSTGLKVLITSSKIFSNASLLSSFLRVFLIVSVWADIWSINCSNFPELGRIYLKETLEFFDTQTLNSEAKKVDAEEELYISRFEVKSLWFSTKII